MKRCKYCGQTSFVKVGDMYECKFCHARYFLEDLESNTKQSDLDIINNSFKKRKEILRLAREDHQKEIEAKLNEMDDLVARTESAIQSIDSNQINDTVRNILKELGIDNETINNNLQKAKEEIDASLHNELSTLSDEIISKLPLKEDAKESNIKQLASSYTAVDLIKLAKDNKPDSFTAPMAMIRHSVEGFLKDSPNLKTIMDKYYVEYDTAKSAYEELQSSSDYVRNPNSFDYHLRTLRIGLGILPLPMNKTMRDFQRTIDNKLYVKVDIPFRFFVAGVLPKKLIKSYKNWKICNLFIHQGAFETLTDFDKKLIGYDNWENANRERMIDMLTNIYNSFKSIGVKMIGEDDG